MADSFVKWDQGFTVNDLTLDSQHRQIIDLIDQLLRAFFIDRDMTSIQEKIEALCAVCREHFHDEERMLMVMGHPEFFAHREMHERLYSRLETLRSNLEKKQLATKDEAFNFLVTGWMVQHILHVDRNYFSQNLPSPTSYP